MSRVTRSLWPSRSAVSTASLKTLASWASFGARTPMPRIGMSAPITAMPAPRPAWVPGLPVGVGAPPGGDIGPPAALGDLGGHQGELLVHVGPAGDAADPGAHQLVQQD